MILRPGVFLQDRYEILEQIGSGGMSMVYKAKCHKLNRLVAIKVLNEEFANDSSFVDKFKMEAQSAAGLTHPNIVSIYDVVDEGKLHYIVMELVEGITLKTYIAKKGHLEIKESIGIAIQVAQGIAAAHECHLIHRDIKPQNMLISRDGKVKVADFGIARAVSAQTMNSAAMGSVHYISPEQARGGLSDRRSDIYSLGVTMYEMVTGKVPFNGETTVAVALSHLEDAVVPPSVYNPEIPDKLQKIILKCMEKKPERRYEDINEIIAELRHVLVQPEHAAAVKKAEYAEPVNKNEDAVDGETRKISNLELEQIHNAQMIRKKEQSSKMKKEVQKQPEKERTQRERPEKKMPEKDNVNPQIEKLFAGAGVVAAVLIIVVMAAVFAKLGGLFQSGTGFLPFGNQQETGTQNEAQNALSDTEVYMPDVLGLSEDLAQEKLKESYLNMKCSYEFSDEVERGMVLRQEPVEGSVVSKWSNVNVVISSGTDKIDLTGLGLNLLSAESAGKVLRARNLNIIEESRESEVIEKGYIISYAPEQVAEGGTVTLIISSGPHVETIEIPNITGMQEADAIAALAEAGLTPGTTELETSNEIPRGSIIRQYGGENGRIELGGKISYVISSGPEEEQAVETAGGKKQRYVASINDVYDFSNLIGPGAGSASVSVMVRLHQKDGEKDIYRELTGPKTFKGSVLLPISYTSIESMNGTDEGEIEVVDVESGAVLKEYPLTFFPMD